MKTLTSLALCYKDNQLRVLNQQKLPHVEEWLICQSPEAMVEIIRALQVRGAQLIGIAASLALAQFAEKIANPDELKKAATLLKSARPTAVNLAHCIDRQMQAFASTKDPKSIVSTAETLFEEDAMLCEKIAERGASLINNGDAILTHCNTGGLVTTGIGTALGIIIKAHQQGKKVHVYVDETRPLLQGGRLTTWECQQNHIPHTLICDNMAASLMRKGKINSVFVGADRIAKNGDFANKIGTYSVAVLAKYHHIPFYVAAPYTTFDSYCPNGESIIVEERKASEVMGYYHEDKQITWAPHSSLVYNPAFDVTPGNLVDTFICDTSIEYLLTR